MYNIKKCEHKISWTKKDFKINLKPQRQKYKNKCDFPFTKTQESLCSKKFVKKLNLKI